MVIYPDIFRNQWSEKAPIKFKKERDFTNSDD